MNEETKFYVSNYFTGEKREIDLNEWNNENDDVEEVSVSIKDGRIVELKIEKIW